MHLENQFFLKMFRSIKQLATGKHSSRSLAHVVQQAGWSGTFEILGQILRYGLVFLIAHLIGAAGLGIYTLALTVGNGAGVIARLGFDRVMLRYLPYHKARDETEKTVGVTLFSTGIVLAAGLIVGAILYFTAPQLEIWWKEAGLAGGVRVIAFAIPFIALDQVWYSGLRGFLDIRLADFLEKIGIPLMTMAALLVGFRLIHGNQLAGVTGAVSAFWLVGLAAAVGLFTNLRRQGVSFKLEPRTWLTFGMPMALKEGLSYLVFFMDILMLPWFLSAGEVGVYSAAVKLAGVVALPLLAVNSIFAPVVADLHGRNDRNALQKMYSQLTWVTTVAGAVISFGLILTGHFLLGIFGNDFLGGYTALAILILGQFVNAATGSCGYILAMTGYAGWLLGNSALVAILDIGLNLILIPRFGIFGAAISSSTSIALINLLQLFEVYFLLRLWPYTFKYLDFRKLIAQVNGVESSAQPADRENTL